MPTLLLTPRQIEDSRLLRSAALGLGWEVERLQRWRPDASSTPTPPVVIYGEPLFVEAVAQALDLELLQPSLDWLAHLPETYRAREIRFSTLAQARLRPGPLFIKPADDKRFPAKVYPRGGAELPAHEGLDESTPTLTSEPVVWELEIRCFVAERQVQTCSIYSRHGELARADDGTWPISDDERRGAEAFASRLLADQRVDLPDAVVLDIGRIAGGRWAVVELNPAYGSGIYGSDPAAALGVIARCFSERSSEASTN